MTEIFDNRGEGGGVLLAGLSEAQALVAKYVRPGSSALDDLRQERLRQFASEDEEFGRHAESL